MALAANIIIGAIFAIPILKDFIPAKAPNPVTKIRIGAGESTNDAASFGGNVPNIALWNDKGDRMGNPVKGGKIIQEDAYQDVSFPHYDSIGNAQPKYLAISAGGNDAICIAYIAVTSPDGDVSAWYGDIAKNCSVDWYYSRTVVGTAGDDPYAPACVWIDGNHSNGLHYQGFGIHLPDFTGSDARSQQYMDRPELMCKSNARFRAYETLGVNDWIPMFVPELPISDTDQDANIPQILGPGTMLGPGPLGLAASRRDMRSRRTRFAISNNLSSRGGYGTYLNGTNNGNATTPGRFMGDRLVSSGNPKHSARELCQSDSSRGADFVSVAENLFCDMDAKEVWPLCSSSITHGCFDLSSRVMQFPEFGRIDAMSGRSIPEKSYNAYHNWDVGTSN